MPNSKTAGCLGMLLGLGLSLASLDASAANHPGTPRPISPRGELGADEQSTIELFEKRKESVAYITTRERVRDPWSRNIFSVPRGTGSGLVWDEEGHVVTNYHVVEGASEARVRLADGRELQAKLVGASPSHDLAVLKIAVGSNPPRPLPVGVSHELKVGQKVLAIGNPFGLDLSLTTGIVSALDRSLTEENGVSIEHLVQTDAAINPGNSGGPLLDSAGRLIGINTAIYSPSGASSGVGFAVPVDTVNRVVPQLIANGKYLRPALGIRVDEELNLSAARQLDIRGVLVLEVTPGSPAAAAGLRPASADGAGNFVPGDIITAVDGKPVDSVGKLMAVLDEYQVGDKVTLHFLRKGAEETVSLKLQSGN